MVNENADTITTENQTVETNTKDWSEPEDYDEVASPIKTCQASMPADQSASSRTASVSKEMEMVSPRITL